MRLYLATLALAVACSPKHTEMSMASSPAEPHAYDREVQAGYSRARVATESFKVLDSAVARGYAATVQACIADSTHGAMGYHHLNRGYVDNRVEIEKPEFLLYERK